MTQQDETGQGTATDQTAPVPPDDQSYPAATSPSPSPYLEAGESVPQAYLAPPQPGQPTFGAPAPASQRSYGSARQAFSPSRPAQPGYGQPGYGQPGDRRPSSARRGFGPQSRRDPALAAPWERLIACVLDWMIIFTASVLAFISPLLRIWHELQAIASHFTNLNSPDAQAAINAISRDPANQHALLYWFLGMFGIALVYFWVQHAAWGATLGKRALGTRVVTAAGSGSIGVGAAGIRTVIYLIGPAVFLLLPSPYNIPGGLLWLADTALTMLDSRAQCLHDKLAGTVVIRQRWLNQQGRSAG